MPDAVLLAEIIRGYVREALLVTGVSLGGWMALFPLRTFVKSIKEKWERQTKTLESVQYELVHQRTNHLSHIERSSAEQVKHLEKIGETLDAMRTDQRILLSKFYRERE